MLWTSADEKKGNYEAFSKSGSKFIEANQKFSRKYHNNSY
jgi:hypothetical protein